MKIVIGIIVMISFVVTGGLLACLKVGSDYDDSLGMDGERYE